MGKASRLQSKPQSMEALRDVLWQTMAEVREDRITPATANAVTNTAGKLLASVRLELEYAKAVGSRPNIALLGNPE